MKVHAVMKGVPDTWKPRERATWTSHVAWPAVVGLAVGVVAFTQSRVAADVSLGHLYFLPLVLAGATIRHRGVLLSVVLVCAALREWLGPFDHTGWQLGVRSSLVLSTYSTVVLFVSHLQSRQLQLTETVRRQRDQLARDLEEAAMLQRQLLPERVPAVPGIDIAAHFYPARFVAGDFYDLIWSASRGDLVLIVADVAGKGAAAAMLMPVVQSAVRGLHARAVPPDQLAGELNDVVSELTGQSRLVTLVYALLRSRSGTLEYVSMGHVPSLLIKAAHTKTVWLDQGGPVAGAIPGATYQTGHACLDSGDILVLYTDGATDSENDQGEPFSQERLASVVASHAQESAAQIVEAVYEAIRTFRSPSAVQDDLTLLVVRRH